MEESYRLDPCHNHFPGVVWAGRVYSLESKEYSAVFGQCKTHGALTNGGVWVWCNASDLFFYMIVWIYVEKILAKDK
jgi:hypothetical protein